VDNAISQGGGGSLLSSENTWTGTSNKFETNTYLATKSGNVGIGRTNPNYTLDVSGNINVSGNQHILTNLDVSGNTYLATQTLSKVGIGTTNPNYTLDVNGNTNVSGNINVSGTTYLATNSNYISRVGIGRTNDAYTFYTLDVSGNGRFTEDLTALTCRTSSDYRMKKDIRTLDKEFTIDNLNPVIYKLINNDKIQTGFIAHEVQEYYPFLVDGEKNGEMMQSINYSGLIPILVKEIRDLKKEISNLKISILQNY